MSDLLIIELIKKDKAKALTIVYNQYYALLFKFIWKMINNYHDTEDILMKTFEKVCRHIENFVPRETSILGWMFGIAKNETINFIRIRQKKHLQLLDVLPSNFTNGENPESIFIRKENKTELNRAVQKLNNTQRQIYQLLMKELKYREIAEELGCPLGTIQCDIFRMKKNLKIYLS